MKLSVVIAAYNEARCLPRCLQSLREQDYRGEYEIIVADNGSSDNTRELARQSGATVVECHQKGVVNARDAGARAAGGEIIVQADADNILPPTWLSRIADHFSAQPRTVALAGGVMYIDEPLWHRLYGLVHRLKNRLHYRLTKTPASILAGNFAVRRDALLSVGGYNLGLPYCGDESDLLHRLKRRGPVAYDPTLVVQTSSRRFRGRFWQFTFGDVLYRTLVALVLHRLTGRPQRAAHSTIRVERRPRPAWATVLRVALPLSLLIGGALYGFFVPNAQLFGKVYADEGTQEKVIALTFDDGPNEPYTSQVLDVLDRYGVKATFFVLGKNVEHYPETTRRIVAAGHVVGNHTWSHRQFDSVAAFPYREIDRAEVAIQTVTGLRPLLFRPPFGQKTPWQLAEVRKRSMIVVTWDVSANDPGQPPSEVIVQRIVRRARPGAIILLHDGNETIHGADRSRTVAALPDIIETLQARGYTFVTVPELLNVPAYLTR